MKVKFAVLAFLFLTCFSQTVEECMECHSDKEFTKFIDDTTEISLYVDIDEYNNSVHQDFECIDCHSTIESAEHDEDLPDVNCSLCHEDVQEAYNESIHSSAIIESDIKLARCKDCHGTHNILPSDDKNSLTNKLNISNTCGNCHSRPEVIKLIGLRGEGPVLSYQKSIHNKILHEENNLNAPTCTDCHGSHSILLMSDPRSIFNKLNIPETCGKCHSKEAREFTESIHWRSVERGHFESPVCNDCHGEHNILSPQQSESATNYLNIASRICARCHSSQELMTRFGLNYQQFTSYMKTYHGLASLKGSSDAATCTSCHEIHSILEKSSPKSSVNKTNLKQTCGKCHGEVSKDFISISVHPVNLKTRNIYGYYIRNAYIWLIILLISGMFLHNLIIFLYYIVKKHRKNKLQNSIQRFQSFEVYQHMLLILSFFTLVVTGFALKFPDSFWVQWLVNIGMNESLRALLHRIAAVILIIISLIQFGYFILHRKGRKEISLLLPKIKDINDFIQNIKYHLHLSKEKPEFGRWDYTEKAEYLALIWGTVVMVITGLILWFPEYSLRYLPFWIFEVAEIIHYFEAILATLAIIIWHWFFVIFHPDRYPMSLTWMNGKITEEDMKEHHPLEFEKNNKVIKKIKRRHKS